MKLYTFIPTNYSSAYFVVANSPEDAVANVISFLKGKAEKEIVTHPPHGYHYAPDYREWINATVDNLPETYAIRTKEIGEVIDWCTG